MGRKSGTAKKEVRSSSRGGITSNSRKGND